MLLTRTDTGAVAHLTMTAPERLNALSDAMLAALTDALGQIGPDRAGFENPGRDSVWHRQSVLRGP